MLLIGSNALEFICESKDIVFPRKCKDFDYLCTEEQWKEVANMYHGEHVERNANKGHIFYDNTHYEFDIAQEGDSTDLLIKWCVAKGCEYISPLNVLYLLKMSHRYKKNSPHFMKTMRDIHLMRMMGAEITPDLEDIYKLRMKETYNYSHPKLNVSSEDFFNGDGVPYVYEHDDIHDAVALLDKPAFRYYIQEGAQVMTSKEAFFAQPEHIRLLGVYEETCVLALERSQIPNNFDINATQSFAMALAKVCTSITSGWFREYAWENYFKVMALYNKMGWSDYIKRFKEKESQCRPYKGE